MIQQAVAGCEGVLTVWVPWGNQHYASGTAQAVLDYAPPVTRLIFSCGWHIEAPAIVGCRTPSALAHAATHE